MDSMPLRRQQESDQQQQQHAAKATKLLDDRQHQQPPASALALFVQGPYQGGSKLVTTATTSPATGGSVFSTGSATATYPRSYFSMSQWRELELQALIYKYMVAGVSVPLELVLPIRRSLLNATPHYSHYQPYPHLQLAMMPTGYWGRSTSDPEPGRCRRTDGKKWRCSREVVAGHKYCERHLHRGRNRSRKHVEVPTPIAGSSGMMKASSPPFSAAGPGEQGQSPSSLAGAGLQPPLDVLLLTQRRPDDDSNIKESFPQSYYRSFAAEEYGGRSRPGGQILRHFFDDWPSEQQQEADTHASDVGPPPASATKLSISIPKQPPKSDFSLGLSTGNSEKRSACAEGVPGDAVAKPVRVSSWSGWVGQAATSMGGPLAEALRISSSTPSPTSVLQKPNASVSETSSSIST